MAYQALAYFGTCLSIVLWMSVFTTRRTAMDTTNMHIAHACTFGGWASVWSQSQGHSHLVSIIFLVLGATLSTLMAQTILLQIKKCYKVDQRDSDALHK